jgi:4-amino-4-deoxy-L-arabinose transferase-like glycosyltransferase
VKVLLLVLILTVSAILRLWKLDELPSGLHVDETANAWNAYCLLKTGSDQHGVRWPVFYLRAFGDNRSTLFAYSLLPIQAMGGLSVWTTRLSAAVGGILAVYLIYWVGTRLFGDRVGLAAAAMLALNPWHLQQSRWGHEASLVPILTLLPVTALLWAGLPFKGALNIRFQPLKAVLAGAVIGICCYGYPVVRIFLPVFVVGVLVVNWGHWWNQLKTHQGIMASVLLILSLFTTTGPLFWKHLTDPAINKRALTTQVWADSDSLGARIHKIMDRYPGHFGLNFLFLNGDKDIALSPPPQTGLFLWDSTVWMVVGVIVLFKKLASSWASRILAVWLITYPFGDLFYRHVSLHSLRSLPGLGALVLLAALGMIHAAQWLWLRHRKVRWIVVIVVGAAVAALNVRFLNTFYHGFYQSRDKQSVLYADDLLKASRWLKPQLNGVDAVFCTSRMIAHSYIYTLIGMEYDPRQWLRDQREFVKGPLANGDYANEEECVSYGKLHFIVGEFCATAMRRLSNNDRPDRVIFIVRPGELELENRIRPVQVIEDRLGRKSLLVFDGQL